MIHRAGLRRSGLRGSRPDLLLDEPVAALLGDLLPLKGELSPARNLDGRACPTFVWATAQDPPGLLNALAWTQALADAGAAVELPVYPRGGHGLVWPRQSGKFYRKAS